MASELGVISQQNSEFFQQPFVFKRVTTQYPDSDIHLVHVTPERHYPGAFAEPIGIEKLAGTLVKNEIPLNISLGLIRNPDGIPQALQAIKNEDPRYVGIGMPLGSLEDTVELLEGIVEINKTKQLEGKTSMEVFVGGNLPTNLPIDHLALLVNTFPFITVVRGWGDKPLVFLLRADMDKDESAKKKIPGLVFKDKKGILQVNNLDPQQDHALAGKPIRMLVNSDMQAFIEGSRDCSHPFCTFCARMPYPTREVWKPMPFEDVIVQMADLSALGVTKATFTDEEALGTTPEHAIEQALPLALAIQDAKRRGRINPEFGFAFSTRSDSIIGLADANRLDVLEALRDAGLSRVYLGIESGIPHDFVRWDGLDIPSQGRRYGKGIRADEHVRAIQTLFGVGLELEIGFIPFDPLMDLGEVEENAKFLLDNNLAQHASEVFNKMRLQAGARYVTLMDHVLEKITQKGQLPEKPQLFKEFNPSTLKVDYDFLHPLVGNIVNLVWDASRETHWALYALKSYYRSKLITGEPTEGRGFETLAALRVTNLELLLEVVKSAKGLLSKQNIPIRQYDEIAPGFKEQPKVQQAIDEYRSRRDGIWKRFLATDMPDYLRQSIVSQFNRARGL